MSYFRSIGKSPPRLFSRSAFYKNIVVTSGAEHGEGVTDPETVFDGAARGDVNYVHFCLEANGEIITASHGAEGSSLLHVAGNTGNTDLTNVSGMAGLVVARAREMMIRALEVFVFVEIFPSMLNPFET